MSTTTPTTNSTTKNSSVNEANPVKSSLEDALGFLGLTSVSGLLARVDLLPQQICMVGVVLGLIGVTVSTVMAIAAYVQKP